MGEGGLGRVHHYCLFLNVILINSYYGNNKFNKDNITILYIFMIIV